MADLAPRPRAVTLAPKVAPHAGRRLFLAYAVLGAAAMAAGVLVATVLSGPAVIATGALYVAIGSWFFAMGLYGVASGAAVQAVNLSLSLIGQGRLREAEALLDSVRSSRVRNVQRVALVQRAMIAMRRGSQPDALLAATAAIQVPVGFMNQTHAVAQRTNAHGIRAIVRASMADLEGARSDIAAVRRDPSAPPQGLARAGLAEALLFERAGDRAGLAALLRRERRLLLEATDPRERALVRGLQRLLQTSATSVYRTQATAAKLPEGVEEPDLGDWVQAIAPGLAPFVRSAPAAGDGASGDGTAGPGGAAARDAAGRSDASGPSNAIGSGDVKPLSEEGARAAIQADRARAAKAATRSAAPRRYAWAAVLAAVVIALVVAFERFAGPNAVRSDSLDDVADPRQRFVTVLALMVSSLIALVAYRIVTRVRRARSESRELTRVATQMLRGDHDGAGPLLEQLALSPHAYVGAQAELLRAQIAERRGDFAAALASCDAALGRLSRYATRVLASDLLLPEIAATRAATLAALDRPAEAAAEIAALPASYPYAARARFRTELLSLARRGDLAAAAGVAARAPADLPIGPRDELLRDMIRATAQPGSAGAGEIERLREELRAEPEQRAWLERVVPGLLSRFERATTHDHDADPDEAREDLERQAEEEASAEPETPAPLLAKLSSSM